MPWIRSINPARTREHTPQIIDNWRLTGCRGSNFIYWFGYGVASDGIVTIANVIWESADIPSRVEPFSEAQK
jgi:hypothetical protein